MGQLLAVGLGLLLGQALPASAAGYPSKPIRIVVPYAPGGPTDILARALAEDMSKALGQSIIVDNRPGATGLIATRLVAKAPNDGYTLLYTSINHTIGPLVSKDAGYDPIRDFTPISRVATSPAMLLVGAHQPFNSVADIIKAAKEPGSHVSFGSSGHASSPHLAGELLRNQTKAPLIHVAYKGNGPAASDLIAGQVSFMFYPFGGLQSLLATSRVRGLAVTSAERDSRFPSVPTMKELGYSDFEYSHPWTGLLGPADLPSEVTEKLSAAVKQAVSGGAVRRRMLDAGTTIVGSTPAEFSSFIRQDAARWRSIIEAAGLQPE